MAESVDAVVVGAGPNGLVAACELADAGWDVVLLEAQPTIGGAVRSAEVWPGTTVDLFSAFYPLAYASPVIDSLGLEAHGLEWVQAPTVVAHLSSPDDPGAYLHRQPAGTAELLGGRDGDAWLELVAQWDRLRGPLLTALFSPLPPVRSGLALLRRAGVRETAALARLALSPVTRLGAELFAGDAGRVLLAGNAMHADVPADAPGSGLFGWLLCMLAQDVGFPVPVGGSGRLSAALASRAAAAGVKVLVDSEVSQVVVRGGRAVGVRTADGRSFEARRAVLADVDAPRLFNDLVGAAELPARLRADLARFQWDLPTVKLNWLVEGGIPWRSAAAREAGTVHFGADVDGLAQWSGDLAAGRPSSRMFALLGQMTTADSSRSAPGTESVWAYTHVADPSLAPAAVTALESSLDDFAPGFRSRVLERLVQLPADLEAADANLHDGAINGGTAQLHQQLVFRPTTGLGRPETFLEGLYLAGASAHPGGGVHGGPGHNAARAALLGSPGRRIARTVLNRLYSDSRSS